jgi:RNA polymerase-binding transcription factor
MEAEHAHELLARSRAETEAELARSHPRHLADDRDPADDNAGEADGLAERGTDEALEELLTRRLESIARAEKRLEEGSYGLSVRSGEPIPDARLEVEPWAELTVEEQARA